jgi:hypothetical protein
MSPAEAGRFWPAEKELSPPSRTGGSALLYRFYSDDADFHHGVINPPGEENLLDQHYFVKASTCTRLLKVARLIGLTGEGVENA